MDFDKIIDEFWELKICKDSNQYEYYQDYVDGRMTALRKILVEVWHDGFNAKAKEKAWEN